MSQRQAKAYRTFLGTGGEIRTLEASLEDSHVSSYITPAELLKNADFRLKIVDLARFKQIFNLQSSILNRWGSR
jgi:hypothetical protein